MGNDSTDILIPVLFLLVAVVDHFICFSFYLNLVGFTFISAFDRKFYVFTTLKRCNFKQVDP